MTIDRVSDIQSLARAREIATRTLNGECDPLLACRDLASLRTQLLHVPEDIFDVFVAVASEVDELPIGAERSNWVPDALRVKDLEAQSYREQVNASVVTALRQLLGAL